MTIFEQAISTHGFDNMQEFHRLVATVPLVTPEQNQKFRKWQNEDGSKAGLLKLFEK